jgi:hypothetical protein
MRLRTLWDWVNLAQLSVERGPIKESETLLLMGEAELRQGDLKSVVLITVHQRFGFNHNAKTRFHEKHRRSDSRDARGKCVRGNFRFVAGAQRGWSGRLLDEPELAI